MTVPHDQGLEPEPIELRFDHGGSAAGASLYWNAVPGAIAYDVVQGDLGSHTFAAGRTLLQAARVLATDTNLTSATEPSALLPAPGRAFFYLVQYAVGRGKSGFGTVSAPWSMEVFPPTNGAPAGGGDGGPLRR